MGTTSPGFGNNFGPGAMPYPCMFASYVWPVTPEGFPNGPGGQPQSISGACKCFLVMPSYLAHGSLPRSHDPL